MNNINVHQSNQNVKDNLNPRNNISNNSVANHAKINIPNINSNYNNRSNSNNHYNNNFNQNNLINANHNANSNINDNFLDYMRNDRNIANPNIQNFSNNFESKFEMSLFIFNFFLGFLILNSRYQSKQ